MTRPIDAIPLWASGDHVPSTRCRCEPIEGSDLSEPSVLVRIHKRMPDPRDVPPSDADRYLWRSRERRGEP